MSSAVVTFKATSSERPEGAKTIERKPGDATANQKLREMDATGQPQKEKKGHRRIDEQGEVSYKRVPTNALMQAIQLGIANSIGSLASMANRDLLLQDFEKIENVAFPASGSATTPSHSFGDFRFRTYAPIAFRYFRELFHIKPEDFLRSICTEPLKELTNAGASGSIFYVSQDDQFIIKTVQHKEAEFLQKLLPGYYMNLNQNPRTLLPKFFGLFCYQSLGKNIRLLVMNNLLPQTITMHEKFDLKGSTYKRMASRVERAKSHPTLKDLDFLENHREGILIDPIALESLLKTISRDCLVLESFKIMDYSLLIGIHNMEVAAGSRRLRVDSDDVVDQVEGMPSTSREGQSPVKEPKNAADKFSIWEAGDPRIPHDGFPARNTNGERLILYLGIIDILQNYRLLKKMEHAWKSLLHDGETISVHNPNFYANRFYNFISENVLRPSLALKKTSSRRRTRKSVGEDEATVLAGTPVTEIPALRDWPRADSISFPLAANTGSVGPSTSEASTSRTTTTRRFNEESVLGPTMTDKKEKKVDRLFSAN